MNKKVSLLPRRKKRDDPVNMKKKKKLSKELNLVMEKEPLMHGCALPPPKLKSLRKQ